MALKLDKKSKKTVSGIPKKKPRNILFKKYMEEI